MVVILVVVIYQVVIIIASGLYDVAFISNVQVINRRCIKIKLTIRSVSYSLRGTDRESQLVYGATD